MHDITLHLLTPIYLQDAIIAIVFAALFGVAVLLGIIFAALPDTFTGALAAGAVSKHT